MTKIDLVKFQGGGYGVCAQLEDDVITYKTSDEALAEDVFNFARNIARESDKSDYIAEFDVGENQDGYYTIVADTEQGDFSLAVEKQIDAYEIYNFLVTVFVEPFTDSGNN